MDMVNIMVGTGDLDEILSVHIRVGPSKPVSYLPISTIERVLGMHVDDYTNLIAQGDFVFVLITPARLMHVRGSKSSVGTSSIKITFFPAEA